MANPALVQSRIGGALNVTSTALAYNSNNTAGNFLAVGVGFFNASLGPVNPTLTDTLGNVWYLVPVTWPLSFVNAPSFIYFCPNCKGGANTVTYNSGQAASNISLHLMEFSGLTQGAALDNWLDSFETNQGSVTGNLSTRVKPTLIIAYCASAGTGSGTITASNGWTVIGTDTTNRESISAFMFVTDTATYTLVITRSLNENMSLTMASFKVPPTQLVTPGGQIGIVVG